MGEAIYRHGAHFCRQRSPRSITRGTVAVVEGALQQLTHPPTHPKQSVSTGRGRRTVDSPWLPVTEETKRLWIWTSVQPTERVGDGRIICTRSGCVALAVIHVSHKATASTSNHAITTFNTPDSKSSSHARVLGTCCRCWRTGRTSRVGLRSIFRWARGPLAYQLFLFRIDARSNSQKLLDSQCINIPIRDVCLGTLTNIRIRADANTSVWFYNSSACPPRLAASSLSPFHTARNHNASAIPVPVPKGPAGGPEAEPLSGWRGKMQPHPALLAQGFEVLSPQLSLLIANC